MHVRNSKTAKFGFTNFNMRFLAVVKDFDFFAKMKIQFNRGMVHCKNLKCFVHTLQLIRQPYTIRHEKIVVSRPSSTSFKFLFTNRDGVSYQLLLYFFRYVCKIALSKKKPTKLNRYMVYFNKSDKVVF